MFVSAFPHVVQFEPSAAQAIVSLGRAIESPKIATVSIEDVQRIVCRYFQHRLVDLVSKDRHKSIAFARHVAMYLCKRHLGSSFPEIGRAFGDRDHTTVISAVRKIEAERDQDPRVRAHLEALERKLAEGPPPEDPPAAAPRPSSVRIADAVERVRQRSER